MGIGTGYGVRPSSESDIFVSVLRVDFFKSVAKNSKIDMTGMLVRGLITINFRRTAFGMVGVPHPSMPMAVFRHHVASIDPNSNIDDIGFIGTIGVRLLLL